VTPGWSWRVLHVVADRVVSMDVRLAIAALAQVESAGLRVSISAFCAEHQLTRKTYYDLRRRYREEGLEGLLPRSRRPLSSPNQTPPAMAGLVVAQRAALVAEGLDAGAQSIRWRLEQQGHDPSALPCVRTIHRILVAAGLVVPQPQKRPRSSYKRFASPWANGCWQLDGHEVALADHTPAVVLRVQDDHSRQIMATLAATSENTADAWTCVQTAIGRHGAPAMFLTDNGSAFSQRRAKGVMSEFEARLRGEGILPITSSVSRPQTCGKKEREWQTLDRWLAARPPAVDLADLQRQLDAYDLVFNHQRRHQALDGLTPAQAFERAQKAKPATEPLAAPGELRAVRVWSNGAVSLGHSQTISIGRDWAHATVNVLREDPICAIFHQHQLLELFHIDPARRHQPRTRR
jgi:transposase InsO family protein